MSSKGIWLTVLMRSAHFNSLTHFDVTQQPLLLHIPCNKFSGGVNHRKRVGMTYLPTMEVKNVNRCFRHLLITPQQLCDGRALLFKISKFIQMSNRNSKVEGKQSSPAIAKLPVSSRYIRKEAKKQIYKCKESCYGKNTNASNVSEGDYGRWTDWEDLLVKFAKHILKNGCQRFSYCCQVGQSKD